MSTVICTLLLLRSITPTSVFSVPLLPFSIFFSSDTITPLSIPSSIGIYILLFIYTNFGFIYTNYVTTYRSTFFKGKHGGYRDYIWVNILTLCISYVSVLYPNLQNQLLPSLNEVLSFYHNQLSLANPSVSPLAWNIWCIFSTIYHYYSNNITLIIGYTIGLHLPYLTRPGMLLSRSISVVDTDFRHDRGALYGFLFKLCFVFGNIGLHLYYIYAYSPQFTVRIFLYTLVISIIWYLNYLGRKENYYFHAHHWCMGLLLTPLCVNVSSLHTWFLYGASLSQFIEGSARWSIAPLFHKYPPPVSSSSLSTTPGLLSTTMVKNSTVLSSVSIEEIEDLSTNSSNSGTIKRSTTTGIGSTVGTKTIALGASPTSSIVPITSARSPSNKLQEHNAHRRIRSIGKGETI